MNIILALAIFSSCKKELITSPPAPISSMLTNDTVKIFPINNSINFSSYNWSVKHSPNQRAAPGNNYWNANSVWVDGKGYLHLTLTKDPASNKWFCAQISSEKKFGNGTYQFWIEGRVDQLDKNVVLGLFNYSGIDYYDEMDFEFSRWGDANNHNLHYTVYPAENTGAAIWGSPVEFLLNEPYSFHRLTRTSSSLKFESYYDMQGRKIHTQVYASPSISKKEMPIYLNLWAFKNLPPSDQKEVEVIIQKFVFTE